MPLRTLGGFVDMTAAQHTEDPEHAHFNIRRRRTADPYRESACHPFRMHRRSGGSARVAAERLEATRVRVALKNRGRRQAGRVSGDYCYVKMLRGFLGRARCLVLVDLH